MSSNEIDQMKQRILDKYKRLNIEDRFTFTCDPGVSCFTRCCGDVNIFLTPYDVMRLKNNLGISSDEFLRKYTVAPFTKEQKLPIVLLKMDEATEKRCFFVDEKGCSVYKDRPWPCRMYPIGMAQAEGVDGKSGEEFYFIMAEDICDGLGQGKEWSAKEWMMNQGMDDYNEFGDMYKHLVLHPFFQQGNELPPAKMEMFYTTLYDLDKFREFLFESRFFDRFEMFPGQIERLKTHDHELLSFGFQWLHFALFGEPTMKVKEAELERIKKAKSEAE